MVPCPPMNTEGTAADGRGRTAVITGGSAGVGLATAKELAGAGWRVIIGCRDVVKGSCAVATLPGTEALKLDLCDDASVDAFAAVVTARSPAIDLLILNAAHVGDATGGSGPQLDAAGREKTFSANHLGHARLTHALLPVLLAGRARVVAVSALGHKWAKLRRDDVQMLRPGAFDAVGAYVHTKLMNVLFASELDRRFRAHGVTAVSAHPGIILGTELTRNFGGWWFKLLLPLVYPLAALAAWMRFGTVCSVEDAAKGIAAAAGWRGETGGYFEVGVATEAGEEARGEKGNENAAWLWEETSRMMGVDADWGIARERA